MATTAQAWQIKGQYFETCSCDFLCPCPTSGLTARPTQGSCTFAMVFRSSRGGMATPHSTASASP